MKSGISTIEIPVGSEISKHLPGAGFYDSFAARIHSPNRSAMEIYLDFVAQTPDWVNALMTARNRLVALFGIKNLGSLKVVDQAKPASAYRVGDRVGIFSLTHISDDEVILEDIDRHLHVRIAVSKIPNADADQIALSTVVHIRNAFGRVYMLFVAPAHKLIFPAMLSRISV